MKKSLHILLVVSLFFILSFALVQAQPVMADIVETKITASDGAEGDEFGNSVSISGDTMVVGAPGDDDSGSFSGSAYVFVRDGTTWTEQAKLTASDGAENDWFGCSVAISGDTLVVGAEGDDDNDSWSGSAYVFVRDGTTWTQQQKLTASDGAAGYLFGCSVSIDGDTVVVGSRWDDSSGYSAGSAYVFQRSGSAWTEQQKLTASDGEAGDQFGISVSISGNTVVAGAWDDDDNGDTSGSAYVFVRDGTTWTQQQKLTASDGAAGDQFGISVSISGDTMAVGANMDDNSTDSGSVYIFVHDGTAWAEEQKLTASDGEDNDWFGSSVSISVDTVVVGANGEDDNGPGSGSVYIFVHDGTIWAEDQKLTTSDGAAGDEHGRSVSISGNNIAVGAKLDDDNGSASGSAYLYRVAQPPVITSIDPSHGKQGEFLDVHIYGENLLGCTAAISLGGVFTTSHQVLSPEEIVLGISIFGLTTPGPRDVLVTGPDGEDILIDGFTVTQWVQPPVITSVHDSQGKRGETLDVYIACTYDTVSAVSFGSGITVNNFNEASGGYIIANITIDADAATGTRDVSVTTAGGTDTLVGGFTVEQKAQEDGNGGNGEQNGNGDKNGEAGGCACGSEETRVSATELLVGWSVIGMCWGGGYYLVRRGSKHRSQ